MTEAADSRLAEVTIDTLEKLAFLFASPVEAPPAVEERTFSTVRVDFAGAFSGGMEVSLSGPVLAELAANMLGAMEGETLSAGEQQDALKELANVICGNVLPMLVGHEAEFNIQAPYLIPADRQEWKAPEASCHLVLENGICRVRVKVDGGAFPVPVEAGPGSTAQG
jgi:CheY-specific phosphatase CheX